jgi:hypothetical protein
MKQPAISSECAASAGERIERLLGEFTRYVPECRIDTKGTFITVVWIRVISSAIFALVSIETVPS